MKDKFRVFETFSGIGAQYKALKEISENIEIVATSEWDINAIISYDCIHNGPIDENNIFTLLKKYNIFDENKLNEYLKKFTFSKNGKHQLTQKQFSSLPIKLKRRLAIANIRTKNLGSITQIEKDNLKPCDLLTYSFPCQDLSSASMGKAKGMQKNSGTRSGLLWEVEKILKLYKQINELPSYLLLENVGNMISQRFKPQYYSWKKCLSKLGYFTLTFGEHSREDILDASHYGLPQKRKRIYAVSFLKSKIKKIVNFEKKYRKLVLDQAKTKDFTQTKWRKILFQRFLFVDDKTKMEEAIWSKVNMTPSRKKFINLARSKNIIYNESETAHMLPTLTTKQDRWPNAGFIKEEFGYRFITPRESLLAMGFNNQDYENIKIDFVGQNFHRDVYYKQAGNSICVNVLKAIFHPIVNNDGI